MITFFLIFSHIPSLISVNWHYSVLVYGSLSGILLSGSQTSPRVYHLDHRMDGRLGHFVAIRTDIYETIYTRQRLL